MNGEHDPVTPPTGWQFKKDETTTKSMAPEPSGVLEDQTSEPTTSLPAPAPALASLPPSIGSDDTHHQAAAPVPTETAPQTRPVTQAAGDAAPSQFEQAPVQGAGVVQPDQSYHADHVGEADKLEWTASDDDHQKPAGWAIMLVTGAFVLTVLVYLITRDVMSTGSIIVAALLYAAFSIRKPPHIRYALDAHGLGIDQKHYAYEQFRSFAVVKDGAASSSTVVLMPMLTVHYGANLEDDIVAIFSKHLPMEAYRRDAMDALIKKLRF